MWLFIHTPVMNSVKFPRQKLKHFKAFNIWLSPRGGITILHQCVRFLDFRAFTSILWMTFGNLIYNHHS